MENLVGSKFGKLEVISMLTSRLQGLYLCRCSCGNDTVVRAGKLKSKQTKSCGNCGKPSQLVTDKLIEDHSYTTSSLNLHSIYVGMVDRCHNPAHPVWSYYGARGITVCDAWRDDFQAFVRDMGARPEGYTLERTKGKLGYFPGNVVWADYDTQARNRRKLKNNSSGKTGVFFEKRRCTWVSEGRHPITRVKSQKGFSIAKMGMMPAYNAACIHRDNLIKEYNSLGAGYSEWHGL